MNRLARRLAAVTTTFGLALGGVVTTSQPASATAADCENGANGFVDIPDNLATGSLGRSPIDMGYGVILQLRYGNVYGAQRGWARIYGVLAPNDRVWMDWTTNNGASWLQCGPFYADELSSKTSAAKTTSSSASYRFRACARLQDVEITQCTPWW